MTYNDELYLRNFLLDLGTVVADSGLSIQIDSSTSTTSQATATLSHTPNSKYPVLAYYDGVLQNSTFFSVSGTTVTFVNHLSSGHALKFVYYY